MKPRALAVAKAPESGVIRSAVQREPRTMVVIDAVDALVRIESELLIFQTSTESETFHDLPHVVIADTLLGILDRIRAVRVSLEKA